MNQNESNLIRRASNRTEIVQNQTANNKAEVLVLQGLVGELRTELKATKQKFDEQRKKLSIKCGKIQNQNYEYQGRVAALQQSNNQFQAKVNELEQINLGLEQKAKQNCQKQKKNENVKNQYKEKIFNLKKENQYLKENCKNNEELLTKRIEQLQRERQHITQNHRNKEHEYETFKTYQMEKMKQYEKKLKQQEAKIKDLGQLSENIKNIKMNSEIIFKKYAQIKQKNREIASYRDLQQQLATKIKQYDNVINLIKFDHPQKKKYTVEKIKPSQLQKLDYQEELTLLRQMISTGCLELQKTILESSNNNEISRNVKEIVELFKKHLE